MVYYELHQIHNDGVLRHLDRGAYYMVFVPMMERGCGAGTFQRSNREVAVAAKECCSLFSD